MKHLITLIALFISLGLLSGQADKSFIDAVQGNDYELAQTFLSNKLDFCVNDDQDYLKSDESIDKLQGIITERNVTAWEVVHKGSSKDGSSNYSILQSQSSSQLRLLVYSEEKQDGSKVSEIRVEY